MAVDNFQSLGGGGGGGYNGLGGAGGGASPSCPQKEGLGQRCKLPIGVFAALTFSLFVVSKNLTMQNYFLSRKIWGKGSSPPPPPPPPPPPTAL